MKLALAFAATLSLLAPGAAALACDGQADKTAVQTVPLEDGSKLSKEKKATFVDANGAETRKKYGIIPAAVLLTSAGEFNASELPAAKDKKLVFYCANEHCGASKTAAKRAMAAGYTDVAVLPDGIMGWRKAGLPTANAEPRS